MKLFGYTVTHDRSPDGRWDISTVISRLVGNASQPNRRVSQQVHYRVRIGLMTVTTPGSPVGHQLVIGSHSWTWGKIS